jgi:tape measure domain-containing protein
MRFDNRQFEQGVQTSLNTISNLRQSLKLEDASKGLEGISDAAKKVDLSGVGSAAETIGLKFSAMYTIADQALRNITNSAMNYGKRIVSALTIDPIKTGLQEYETQIGAVQTILANTESKGSTLEDVNGALDKLNKYADKTIYNFTEMTRNIGTFTAAGVDLDTSVKSIQGIANLAAVSGSTSQQASTAMYQLSQALASGKVSLMDWNSVVNAGMGGQVFQDALKRTATAMGTDVDALIEKYGSFRESLTQGEWLTADVLTKTLEQFTMSAEKGSKEWEEFKESLMAEGYTEQQAEDILKMANTAENAATKVKTFSQLWDTLKETAQSGWTQTWEILVGDFEEAKETLSMASDVLGELVNGMSEARNELLQGWKDLGGRTALIDAIANAFNGVMNVVKPIGQAFKEIFPALKPEQLLAATESLRDGLGKFAKAFEEGSKNAENLKRTFKGLFAVVDIVRQVFVAVFKAVTSLFGGVGELGSGVLSITAYIGDFLVKIRDVITSSDIFNQVLQGIAAVAKTVFKVLGFLVKGIGEFVIGPGFNLLGKVLEKISYGMTHLGEVARKVKGAVVGAFEEMGTSVSGSTFFDFIKAVWKGIIAIGSGVAKAFSSLVSGGAALLGKLDFSSIIEFINALSAGGISVALLKFAKGFGGAKDAAEDGLGAFGGIFQTFKDIGSGVIDILDGVKGCMEAYQNQLKAGTLMKIAGAIAILAASILVLSFIEADKLAVALGGISGLFAELLVSMAIFSKMSGNMKNTTKSVAAMLGLATAVLILSIALKNVAGLSTDELAIGVAGIASLTTVMVIAAKALSKNKKAIKKGATQMVIFAAAIKILAGVCKDLATLSWEQLGVGLTGVGVLLAEVSLFMNKTKFSGKAMTTATGIVILAAALKIMASACKDFSQMTGDELVRGLGSITAIMIALVAFTKLTGGTAGMLGVGIGMLAVAGAVKIFASAVGDLGSLSWEQLAIGLAGLAGALIAITVAVRLMPKDIAITGIGLLIVAGAIAILAKALSALGSMTGEGALQSILVLAGALGILAIAVSVMSGAIAGAAGILIVAAALAVLAPVLILLGSMSLQSVGTSLLMLAGTFAVIGLAAYLLAPVVPVLTSFALSLLAMGAAIFGIGAGLALLGAGITALAAAIMAGVGTIVGGLSMLLTGIIAVIVGIVDQIAALIVAICQAIIKAVPAICEAIAAVLVGLLQALIEIIPPLMECVALILDEVIKLLDKYVPIIVDLALRLIVEILEAIAEYIDDVAVLALKIVEAFINGIAEGLPGIIDSAVNLIIAFVNGLADGIRKATDPLIAAVDNLMDAVVDAIVKWFVNAVRIGGDFVGKLVEGLLGGVGDVVKAAGDIVKGLINGLKAGLKSIGNTAKELGSAALNGIKKALGINSPSKEFAEIGEFSGEGLIGGLESCSGKVSDTAGEIGTTALDSMREAVSGLGDAMNSDFDSQPTIKPVLDLSEVESGASTISNLLGQDQTVGVNADAISSNMNHQNQNGTTDDVVSALDKLRKDISGIGGTTYNINGITYDEGSSVAEAIKVLVRAAKLERRVN